MHYKNVQKFINEHTSAKTRNSVQRTTTYTNTTGAKVQDVQQAQNDSVQNKNKPLAKEKICKRVHSPRSRLAAYKQLIRRIRGKGGAPPVPGEEEINKWRHGDNATDTDINTVTTRVPRRSRQTSPDHTRAKHWHRSLHLETLDAGHDVTT